MEIQFITYTKKIWQNINITISRMAIVLFFQTWVIFFSFFFCCGNKAKQDTSYTWGTIQSSLKTHTHTHQKHLKTRERLGQPGSRKLLKTSPVGNSRQPEKIKVVITFHLTTNEYFSKFHIMHTGVFCPRIWDRKNCISQELKRQKNLSKRALHVGRWFWDSDNPVRSGRKAESFPL